MMVNYKIHTWRIATTDRWQSSLYCKGHFLTTGYGDTPIEAAHDATKKAYKLNQELERLI